MNRTLRCIMMTFLISITFAALNPVTLFARQEEPLRGKAWLGVSIRDVPEKIAKENKLSDDQGAYVNEVNEKGPADSVGIKEGDVIIQFGQKSVNDADDLVRAVEKSKVGEKVEIIAMRDGEKKSFHVILAKYPHRHGLPNAVRTMGSQFRFMFNGEHQGMRLMELNDQLGEYFGVPNGTGILVERVNKGSAAEKAGIKAGDVLLKIGKRTIDDLEDVSKAFSRLEEGDKVDVEVLRKGTNKTFSLEIAEDHESPMFELFRRQGPDGEEFMMPGFERNSFRNPRWNNQDYKFEFHDFGPNMEILRQKVDEMSRSFRNDQKGLEKGLKNLRSRST